MHWQLNRPALACSSRGAGMWGLKMCGLSVCGLRMYGGEGGGGVKLYPAATP